MSVSDYLDQVHSAGPGSSTVSSDKKASILYSLSMETPLEDRSLPKIALFKVKIFGSIGNCSDEKFASDVFADMPNKAPQNRGRPQEDLECAAGRSILSKLDELGCRNTSRVFRVELPRKEKFQDEQSVETWNKFNQSGPSVRQL